MSLQWDFKNKIGYVNTEENTLYHGNALMIMLFETEKEYQLQAFFCDKEHAKRCLKDNMFEDGYTFHLYKDSKDKRTIQLAKLLTEYKISVIWEDRKND